MKIKTSELIGAALDFTVCKAVGLFTAYPKFEKHFLKMWQGRTSYYIHPSTNWAQGGPIIEREGIAIGHTTSKTEWGACMSRNPDENAERFLQDGSTPLIAAMRCYVVSKFSNEVEVPEELVDT